MEQKGQNPDLGPFPHGPCPRTYEVNPEKTEKGTGLKLYERKVDDDVLAGLRSENEYRYRDFSDDEAQGYPAKVRSRGDGPTGSDPTGAMGEQTFISGAQRYDDMTF